MTTLKLCRDCKHCVEDIFGAKCGHPDVPPRNLATGELEYADMVRQWRHYQNVCGISAKKFEPKPPPAPEDTKFSPFRYVGLILVAAVVLTAFTKCAVAFITWGPK